LGTLQRQDWLKVMSAGGLSGRWPP
jgi:hypothetical protein